MPCCQMYKETRDVSEEEIGKKDECDMETFGTLDSNERAIDILGDRWWPQATKQEGDKMSKNYMRNIRKKRTERPKYWTCLC